MRLAGRQWRTRVSAVRLGRDSYRVIRPEHPVVHASLYEGRYGPRLAVDKAATVDLAFAWWPAARSPRSLVYLPVRSGAPTCGEDYGGEGRKLDLVLLHHSLRFPVSRWKQVRARLAPSAAHTVTLPPNAFPVFSREEHRTDNHREFKDHLRWAVAADTLFLVGSRLAYEREADRVRGLAEDGPAQVVGHPETYCCTEITLGQWKMSAAHQRNPSAELHVDRCHEHWPAPQR
ncbi:hypothetical protein BN6_44550 [Saccharothrix espanaensis DSM 44229]|uniref:Uncharacterized protein n=1 Tax=Saccharothrix espanaensis (strain ATCC 51144 / DSM 44229 / JCM 9112 / NBRC 15066 / NRRL 15764) TaxID=1179773 RepID=K0K085_SACES|nr:hypothetical protein BN6_44550 [Saccharothrix espanaensis DSM 44229]